MKAFFDSTKVIEKVCKKLSLENTAYTAEVDNHLRRCLSLVVNELLWDYPLVTSVGLDELEINDDALFYGTCAEYSLISGNYDESNLFNMKFKEIVEPYKRPKRFSPKK